MLTEVMRKASLPHIHEFSDRYGKQRRYVRRKGIRIALKSNPGTPEYLTEYQAALTKTERRNDGQKPGTWNDLIVTYYSSAKFKTGLKDSTKSENRREAERIRERWGSHPVNRLEARHILKWQDELSDKPGSANNMLAMVKLLLTFGTQRGFAHKNPAAGISELKIGAYRSWTNSEISKFEKHWPTGTRERLIFDLALYTGQRRGDLISMTRHHISGDVMGVVQEKTGERVAVPVHANLKASIETFKSSGIALLQRTDGAPLKARELHNIIASAIDEAGLPKACVLHGLRYSAARCLAEAGATPHEIMSVTGHRTLGMVEKYTRQANKEHLAGSAMEKLTAWRTRTEQESGKLSEK